MKYALRGGTSVFSPSHLLSWKCNLFKAYLSRQVEEEHIVISSRGLGGLVAGRRQSFTYQMHRLTSETVRATASCEASEDEDDVLLRLYASSERAEIPSQPSLPPERRRFVSYIRAGSWKLCRSVKLWRPFSWLSNYRGLNCDTET